MGVVETQWIILIVFSLALFAIAPWAKDTSVFFRATKKDKQPGFLLLMSSLVISWIFAKSITNAANLGMAFGFVGGVSYSVYYLSFLVAGVIIYRMRTKGGFRSIHQFLQSKFGFAAVAVFSLLIGFRLFNEVWSNTMVIGSYFGPKGSQPYFLAVGAFTLLTLTYSMKGGLRSSLITDMIQMILFGGLLFVILGMVLPAEGGDIGKFVSSGEWTLATGVNLLLVAFLQVFSYPFHDPVLTDRAFIASPKVTLKSFLWATPVGMLCIVLFSFVGIHAKFQGMTGQAAVEVAKTFGVGMMLMMNFIMVTSAASTLDSTFASFSKLVSLDLRKKLPTVRGGRIAMLLIAVAGTIPVFLGPEILSATTISGTMVMGLAPVFIFWNKEVPPASFHLSVGAGILFGIVLAVGGWPEQWVWFPGKYGDLLSVNLVGLLVCVCLFFIPTVSFFTQRAQR